MANRARDWLRQAEEEYRWGADGLKNERWAMVCFTAQQVAEKACKALALHRGATQIRTHAVKELTMALGIDGGLEECGMILDQYYISTRYPDSFSSGAPFEYFTSRQATEALGFAKAFLDLARAELENA